MLSSMLTVVGFVVSLVGIVSSRWVRDRSREVVLFSSLAIIVATSGVATIHQFRFEREVGRVRLEIRELLGQGEMTFDELYRQLPYRAMPLFIEALGRGVNIEELGTRLIRIQVDGRLMDMRVFYLEQVD